MTNKHLTKMGVIHILYVLSFLLFVSALVTLRTSIRYSRHLKNVKETIQINMHLATLTKYVSFFLVIGYLVGAFDVAVNGADQMRIFICLVFLASVPLLYFLLESQISMTAYMMEQNENLSKNIRKAEDKNKNLEEEVELRLEEILLQDKLLITMNEVANVLLSADFKDFEKYLSLSMEKLAVPIDIHQMYIITSKSSKCGLESEIVALWHRDEYSDLPFEKDVKIPFFKYVPNWVSLLSDGNIVNASVTSLNSPENEMMEKFHIKSILIIPVTREDSIWGVVCFCDCKTNRLFSDLEKTILSSVSLLLANAIMGNKITERLDVSRKEALASTKAKSDFLANMSHEIRTPINAITGMCTIARKSNDINCIKDCLYKVDNASRQLLGLINDILDMSKIEAGKLELVNEPFYIRKAMYNIRSIIGVRASEKNQVLTLSIDEDIPEMFTGDEMRLSQILINLLSNAVKFTPEEGKIHVDVILDKIVDDDAMLTFLVTDTGIGISAEHQENLFNAFEQAEKSTAKRFGGTGLGLAISKSLSEMMGGSIYVTSELGKGSKFIVKTVMEICYDYIDAETSVEHIASDYNFSNYTVLLVEDIQINREIVISLLSDTNIQIETAQNGMEAVEKFAANPLKFDLIFMDIHMPIMDGYTTTIEIRGLEAENSKTIPIIAMTANVFSEEIERCINVGMNDHIPKPLNYSIMLKKMASYLKPFKEASL